MLLFVFSTDEISISLKFAITSLPILLVCVLVVEAVKDRMTVLTITQDEIVLTKFGREVTSFR